MEKDKDIDFDLLQDLMDVDIDPLDIDLEKDPLAAKVFKVCWFWQPILSLFSFLGKACCCKSAVLTTYSITQPQI